ncbi:induced myeloid leukemia cell differentiation protein Mcl-1 homolog [Hypanus sabinus]|uniref:induced myeloid leukemia cell differentiation protein Mcl-1 homolog n=1 Tax=Hypanus sabinus TaxID=79690 RepID=UPI0028C4E144|nr:induced myeloid leukemia cell differentiation protein Mcl-1 homolog [Hypanus sabinus]
MSMEQTLMALNRSSTSTMLQLQNQFYCLGPSRGPAAATATATAAWAARDGSLPQSPVESEPPCHDALYSSTYSLVDGFLREYTGAGDRGGWLCWRPQQSSAERQAAETLQRIGGRLIEKHRTAFTGMINRLNNSNSCNLNAISGVAAEMFSDGEVNWGRIVSLIAFGAVLGDYLKKSQPDNYVDEIATQITQYLTKETREWLETHNSWDGFTKFFHESNSEESAKKALMWIAGVGIAGASIMHLLR